MTDVYWFASVRNEDIHYGWLKDLMMPFVMFKCSGLICTSCTYRLCKIRRILRCACCFFTFSNRKLFTWWFPSKFEKCKKPHFALRNVLIIKYMRIIAVYYSFFNKPYYRSAYFNTFLSFATHLSTIVYIYRAGYICLRVRALELIIARALWGSSALAREWIHSNLLLW